MPGDERCGAAHTDAGKPCTPAFLAAATVANRLM